MEDFLSRGTTDLLTAYRRVLTIAGSDSGGGAGIQADIKTVSSLGCYASSAITAITVQNTLGVSRVQPVEPDLVADQIRAVLSDIGSDAVKIGMLPSAGVVRAVAGVLRDFNARNVVLDPVMVSTSGMRLMDEDAREALVHELIPLVSIVTPNVPEAVVLLGRPFRHIDDNGRYRACPGDGADAWAEVDREMRSFARALSSSLGTAVLLKGGHVDCPQSDGEPMMVDYFCPAGGVSADVVPMPHLRVNTVNTHGTGCTLSSAIAALLADGYPLCDAVRTATKFVSAALASGARHSIGHGHGPLNPLFL